MRGDSSTRLYWLKFEMAYFVFDCLRIELIVKALFRNRFGMLDRQLPEDDFVRGANIYRIEDRSARLFFE